MSPDEPEARLTPKRWREVEVLFMATRDRVPGERATFLEEACGTDAALRQEVESLLAADQGATGFLEQPGPAPLMPDLETALRAKLAGRYALERELGHGGMATVYLAEDVRHHRQVAIKVLHPELGAVLGADRFLREIGIAARLNHPHILPLHDSGTLDLGLGRPVLFYAMPYVSGRSLRERLREELQLPMEEALAIARQVADALDHAHRQGVIHRDIKPENILLAEGQAVLADFGIARALDVAAGDRLTETGLAIGTPAYMSPEQSAGSTQVDARSDIYSLGCVLYEMLGGQPPFSGPSPQAILARHAIDPVPSLRTLRPTVPRALALVVTRSLAKVPADRFPTARGFAEAVAAAAAAPAGSGDDTSTIAMDARRVAGRRRPWLRIAAALAVVATAAAAALALRLGRKPVQPEPTNVIVLPFQNRTGDSTLNALGDVVADYIVSGLRGANESWSGVGEVVDARSQADGETARRLTRSAARVLATDANSGTIVLGAYDRAPGDSVHFQAEVLDTRTGRALRLIGPVSAPVEAPLAALTGVRTRVMAAVSSMLDLSFSEETSLPETYEALKEYKAGDGGLLHCQGDASCEAQGIAHMRRATAIDSNFTMPLTSVAFRFMWSNCGLVDSIAAELRPRLQRLPAEDVTQLNIATFLCDGDLPSALDRAGGGDENSPGSENMADWKAMLLLSSNRPRAVIRILASRDQSRARQPDLTLPMILGAYHRLGQYDSALAFVARMRRTHVNTNMDLRPLYLEEEAASLAALGRVAEVAKVMDLMVRQLGDEHQGLSVVRLLETVGLELAAHGHAAAAQQAFDRAIAWLRAQPPEQQAAPDARRALAGLLNSAGRWDEALARYRSVAAADSGDFDAWFTLADLAARRGDRAEAERIDQWLAARGRQGRRGAADESWGLYGRARIAGLLGEHARAVGLLRQAAQKGFSGWRVAHRDPDLAPLRADPAFREWIRPKD
jgi:tetratricopeptide (TPR) repeat protein/TolB-like protein